MDELRDNYVKIEFDDIFWEINVKDTGRKNGKKEASEPIIRLSWGWNPDEDEDLAKEGWHGEHVDILLEQAKMLRDKLDEVVKRVEPLSNDSVAIKNRNDTEK